MVLHVEYGPEAGVVDCYSDSGEDSDEDGDGSGKED